MALSTVLKFVLKHPLNRHRRLKSLATFARWQLASRLHRGDFVVDWVGGAKLLVRSGETGLTGNVYAGLHEFADMAFVLHALRPDQLFVDVGANVGSYTVLGCAGAKARGVCFEPVPSTFERLRANLRINALETTVRARNVGVGASAGSLRFTAGLDTTNHAVADGETVEGQTVSVDVVTLDAELREEAPSVIKVDVEGFETAVIAGASRVLANSSLHSIILELNGSGMRYGYDEAEIVRSMAGCGFQPFTYEPFRRRLVALGGRPSPTGNTLFIRGIERVTALIENAPSVRIHDIDL